MSERELQANELAAYQALCSFLAWALYSDIDEETFASFAEQAEAFGDEPFASVAPGESAALVEVFSKAKADMDASWQEIHRDRTFLFYMVGASRTSPYESVYRTDDATLFGPTTLEVRAAYKAWGLEYADSAKQPDDHAGLEFSFVADLLGRAAQGESAALDAARDFLSDHLLVFSGVYFANLKTQAGSAFYQAVAGLGEKTLESLAGALGAKATDAAKTDPLHS